MDQDKAKQLFIWGVGILCVLIVGGIVWAIVAGPSGPSTQTGVPESNLSFNDDNDPALGPATSTVTVRIFGDLQCPACDAAEPGVEYAMATYASSVRFIWDDFPLVTLHPNAMAAAEAARCAEEQGKFWDYRQMLYEHQTDWADLPAPTQTFVNYAKALSLNPDSFSSCIASQTYTNKIQADLAEGTANNVEGTPTFFVNNIRFTGALTNAQWDTVIKAALAAKK